MRTRSDRLTGDLASWQVRESRFTTKWPAGTLMDDRRMMRNSGQDRLMRRRRMNETSGSKRVDEPVDRIPVHRIAVDRARWYHSRQRYPSRLYLVRGGDGRVRGRMARNRATSMYRASPVLRHNWNSMTATRTRVRPIVTTPTKLGGP